MSKLLKMTCEKRDEVFGLKNKYPQMTNRDISRLAEIGNGTVSRILNGNYGQPGEVLQDKRRGSVENPSENEVNSTDDVKSDTVDAINQKIEELNGKNLKLSMMNIKLINILCDIEKQLSDFLEDIKK